MNISENTKKAAITAIQKIANTYDADINEIIFAKVISVDETERTCIVSGLTGGATTTVEGVSLTPDRNDGETKVPAIGSTVAVAISNQLDAFIIAWSDLEKINWKGGNFGGLTKTIELKTQLDRLNAQLQAIISSLTNWVPVDGDGGRALKTFFATQIAGKPAGSFTNIENVKIKHGDK